MEIVLTEELMELVRIVYTLEKSWKEGSVFNLTRDATYVASETGTLVMRSREIKAIVPQNTNIKFSTYMMPNPNIYSWEKIHLDKDRLVFKHRRYNSGVTVKRTYVTFPRDIVEEVEGAFKKHYVKPDILIQNKYLKELESRRTGIVKVSLNTGFLSLKTDPSVEGYVDEIQIPVLSAHDNYGEKEMYVPVEEFYMLSEFDKLKIGFGEHALCFSTTIHGKSLDGLLARFIRHGHASLGKGGERKSA